MKRLTGPSTGRFAAWARRLTNGMAVGVAVLGLAAVACACNVPVFRFALERWRPDPYRVVLLHKGPLTAADLETIRPLEEHHEQSLANLSLRTIDVDELARAEGDDEAQAADRELVKAFGDGELPRLIVQYPASLQIQKPIFVGPAGRESIAGLLDSPARRELVKRLTDGQTAVWILLEPAGGADSGDAANLLGTELPKLQQELKLPELTTAPEDTLLAETPLRVEFSLLRVRRDDPKELALVAMLIGSEPDLAERNDPMVFPVFGRGRALLPLIGAGITGKNIHDAAAFLVGACSCEVKELNPGFDLLIAADWEEQLASGGERLVTPPPTAVPSGPPVLVPIPTGAAPTTVTVTVPTIERSYSLNLGGKLLVIGGAVFACLVLVAVFVTALQNRSKHEERDAH
jgi:hypothetical protein